MGSGETMRTLEFGLYPTSAQSQQLDAWLILNRRIWNYGLALLRELDAFSAYDKASKTRVPCCPLPWSYRWERGSGDAWQAIPYSPVRRFRDAPLTCPIPQPWRQPRLDNDSYFSLAAFFSKKNHPTWAELQGCPSSLIRGTLKALATSWREFKKGKRKSPRFKSQRFPITTLSDNDCKASAHVNGNTVKLPTLGIVRIRGNRDGRRWPADRVVATFRLQREPSGWFLLLVGDVASPVVRDTPLAVGIDAGVAHTLTTSTGKHIDGPAALAGSLRKLERLQQQMARQKKGGANWRKTVAKVARLHERIRRTRKLFAHKATTFLLRTYSKVAIEDLKLANMTRRPAPKPAEDGQSFLPNNAAAKSGLNRSMLDAGIGSLFTMLEAKAQERGRIVERISPANTSRTCPSCGTIDKGNRISQAKFRCVSCEHTMNADHNAAVNILRSAWPDAVVPMAPAPLAMDRCQLVLIDPSAAAIRTKRRPATRRTVQPIEREQLALLL
jgi:putative transposase